MIFTTGRPLAPLWLLLPQAVSAPAIDAVTARAAMVFLIMCVFLFSVRESDA
jgi:hypothetical protein